VRVAPTFSFLAVAVGVSAAFAGRLAVGVGDVAATDRSRVASRSTSRVGASSGLTLVAVRRAVRAAPQDVAEPADPDAPRGVVHGLVLDPRGAPARGAEVCVFLSEEEKFRTTTDDQGRWCVRGVRFDLVVVDAETAGTAASDLITARLDDEHPDVTVDLRLREFAWLDLAVSTPDGVVPAECDAYWSGAESCHDEEVISLDAVGCGSMPLRDEGTATLRVNLEPYPPCVAEIEVARGRRTPVHVAFEQGVALEGRVVDDRGCAVAGAAVSVDRDPRHLRVEADDHGAFRVAWLAAAGHDITVTADHHDEFKLSGFVPDGRTPLRVVLPREGAVALRLGVRGGAAPPANVELCGEGLEPHAERGLNETLPWSEATQSVAVRPGRWHLVVARHGFARVDRVVDVVPGETTDLGLVELDEGVTLSGHVTDLHGGIVVGAEVHVDWDRNIVTDAAGRFVLDHMPRREIDVDVSADGFLGGRVTANPLAGVCPVALRRGALVRGAAGPCRWPRVRLTRAGDPASVFKKEGDSDGRFSVRVPPGRWTVELVDDDTVLASKDLDLSEDDVTDVDLAPGR
jgi:hypothetical protein